VPTDAASSQAPASLGPATGKKGTLDGPDAKASWTFTAGGPVDQVAVLGDHTLVVTGNDATGLTAAGTVKYGPLSVGGLSGNSNQITTAGNLYYIPGASQNGSGFGMFVIDPAAGSIAWNVLTPTNDWQPSGVYGLLGTTAIVGGTTLEGVGQDAFIWAVDTTTHKTLWTLTGTQSGAVFVPPTGTKIVVGQNTTPSKSSETAQVTVYDIGSKTFGWKKAVKDTANFTSPGDDPFAWAGGLVVWAASTVTAVDPATGTQKWSYKEKDFQTFSPPTASPDGKTVFAVEYDTLYALDAASGQLKWKTQAPGKGFGFALGATAVQVADGNVYCWDADFTLWAVDAASGTTRWKMEFPNASGGSDMAFSAGGGRAVVAVGKAVTAIAASGR
jgi:outer membrane protein assembly factor BamB